MEKPLLICIHQDQEMIAEAFLTADRKKKGKKGHRFAAGHRDKNPCSQKQLKDC